jgi:anaerobic magnesium-protoporphyrin IX monomethyl ester cyclase
VRILLIDPPGKNKGLNSGLGYLSAALESSHEVRVLDLNNIAIGRCGDPNPEISIQGIETRVVHALNNFEPGTVGVSTKTFTSLAAERILRLVKNLRPQIFCVAGGPHITLDGANFVRESGADFGFQGEGESGLPALCDALEGNGRVDAVKGLFYRCNGEVRHNKPSSVLENLDSLVLPNYEHFSSIIANGGRIPEYPLLTSRGCPYNCSYCSMPEIMGRRWRPRDPINVIEELQQAKSRYRSTSFTVVDDNLTLNPGRVERICDLLISAQLNLPWNSQNGIRADRVTRELAQKMKGSGCRHVWVGIESADDDVFAQIDKGESLQEIRNGIRNLREAGIRVGGFFIVGLPGSTSARDLKIVSFVRDEHIDCFVFGFVPYPKTRANDWVQQNGTILRPSAGALQFGSGEFQPVFETHDYPKAERISTFNEINVSLGSFANLGDASLGQCERWRRVYRIVGPYGGKALIRFFVFIARYNATLPRNWILTLYQRIRSASLHTKQ